MGVTVEELEGHRDDVRLLCYRMLGSVHDADDVVQETFLRAWRARESYDPARASVRTWLHRIATNASLTALQGRRRRELPSGTTPVGDDPEAPLTPAPDVAWLEPLPDPGSLVVARETVSLAFVAALQLLPARQRAALLLRDVLAYSAAETAELLDTSVASVTSALQRARATIAAARPTPADQVPEPAERALLERYVAAFEAADVAGLTRLLAEDVVLEMPPVPLWLRGRSDYAAFLHRVFRLRGTGWRMTPTRANGQPALVARAPAEGGGHVLHSVQVLELGPMGVTRNTTFAHPAVVARFRDDGPR